jgi:hypothetical protein
MPFDVIWMEVEMAKMRVGIVFGGKSAEHEVSLQSAKNIVKRLINRASMWFCWVLINRGYGTSTTPATTCSTLRILPALPCVLPR